MSSLQRLQFRSRCNADGSFPEPVIGYRNAPQIDWSNMFFRAMQKFRVLVEGENLLMEVQGVQRLGLYTTRYVEAADAEEASQCAIDLAKNELVSTGALLNEHGDPPIFVVRNGHSAGTARYSRGRQLSSNNQLETLFANLCSRKI